ncbi:hypothetical protein PVAG01_08306 [Phlyctema vagabunda]|uniref:NWD NACHT-NTPase N-terminal domain-containing protein n=1 Tax=Phlyctema vagabunda TaxID=108571 RepID=A0ABR4P916_9HELO
MARDNYDSKGKKRGATARTRHGARRQHRDTRRRGHVTDTDSDSPDTSELEPEIDDDDKTNISTKHRAKTHYDVEKGGSTETVYLQVPKSRHKRVASSSGSDRHAAANSSKSQYDMLWDAAKKEFKRSHPHTAKDYYALEKSLSQKAGSRLEGKTTDDNDFYNTIVQTKATTSVSVIASLDPMIAQPAWSGACILLKLCLNWVEKPEQLLDAIETVFDITRLYSALRDRYSKIQESAFKERLYERTKSMFSNILYFQASVANHLNGYAIKRKAVEVLALDEWSTLIAQIKDDNKNCIEALDQEAHERVMAGFTTLEDALKK